MAPIQTAKALALLLAMAVAEIPTKQNSPRKPHVNSYVKHLMELRNKETSHSEPKVAASSTAPVVAKKPSDENNSAPAKKAAKAKASMASISAKVLPVKQPEQNTTNSYVAKLRATKPAEHEKNTKATKAEKKAEPKKRSEAKKTAAAKAVAPLGEAGRKVAEASGLAHVISNIDAAEAAKSKKEEAAKAKVQKPKVEKVAAQLKSQKETRNEEKAVPLGNAGKKAAEASGLAHVISNINAAEAAKSKDKEATITKVHKAEVGKVAAQLKSRKETTKEGRKVPLVKAEKKIDEASEVAKSKNEETTVRKVQVAHAKKEAVPKEPQAQSLKSAAVKAHDAAKSALPQKAEQTATIAEHGNPKKSKAAASAKVPAPLPSVNVQAAESRRTGTGQRRESPEIKKLPCQGFEGQPCRHVDTHTATGDWRTEYGPQPVRAGAPTSGVMAAVLAAAALLPLV